MKALVPERTNPREVTPRIVPRMSPMTSSTSVRPGLRARRGLEAIGHILGPKRLQGGKRRGVARPRHDDDDPLAAGSPQSGVGAAIVPMQCTGEGPREG